MPQSSLERVHCSVAHTLLEALRRFAVAFGEASPELAEAMRYGATKTGSGTIYRCESLVEKATQALTDYDSGSAATCMLLAHHHMRNGYVVHAVNAVVKAYWCAFDVYAPLGLAMLAVAIDVAQLPQDEAFDEVLP